MKDWSIAIMMFGSLFLAVVSVYHLIKKKALFYLFLLIAGLAIFVMGAFIFFGTKGI